MPLKLLSPGGGSVLLQANTTSLDYTLTVPAETANLITTATTSGINASAMSLGTIPTARLPTIPKANMPTGSVIQVVQTTKTDIFSTTSTSYTDVTGLSVSITPTYATSKLFVIGGISLGPTSDVRYATYGRLMRNGSAIFIADAAGNRDRGTFSFQQGGFEGPLSLHFNYLDSPNTTSAVTYNIQIRAETGSAYINRGMEGDGDSIYSPRAVSSLTVMEIVG